MKYPPARLPFLKLGDSDLVKIGEEIVIIGYPFGLGKSLSVGHIGGFHKVDEIVDVELFQTDGSINVGNSGGPVFNTAGEVVGIVSSIYSKSGGFDGVGFIATINMVKKHLIERQNPWLGLDAMLVNGALSRALNIPASGGILVENVADFSPADGLANKAAGDRVVQLRTYTATEGNLPSLDARFRDHTIDLFAKHGIENLIYWHRAASEPHADRMLVYLIGHASEEAAAESFAAFRKDPAWTAARKASEEKAGGSLTEKKNGVVAEFLKPTDYSPWK